MTLQRYLVTWTVGAGLVILVLGSLLIVLVERDAARRDLELTADTVSRLIEVQMLGLEPGSPLAAAFPEWLPVSRAVTREGLCVRLRRLDGSPWRSECRGSRIAAPAPDWFVAALRRAGAAGTVVERPIANARGAAGTLLVESDAAVDAARAWTSLQHLGGLKALTVAVVCLVIVLTTRRALEPAGAIVAGIERIAKGDLGQRLGDCRYEEFARIARAVDDLAGALAASDAARADLAARLLRVQEEERVHLARELHDEFGQHLAGIAASAAALRHATALAQPGLAGDAQRIEDGAGALMTLVRGLLSRLRPPGVDEAGLPESLRALVRDWNHRCGARTRFTLRTEGDIRRLPAPMPAHVYRIVQECLTNSARHANASRVDVTLVLDDGVRLSIEDDGTGTDDAFLDAPGYGLLGMRERVAALSGRIEYGARAGGGLAVRAWLPVPAATPA